MPYCVAYPCAPPKCSLRYTTECDPHLQCRTVPLCCPLTCYKDAWWAGLAVAGFGSSSALGSLAAVFFVTFSLLNAGVFLHRLLFNGVLQRRKVLCNG